jgi:acetolactate synthase-1/2/3 large subunit
MKLSDYVASYIKSIGIGHVFGVSGGGVMHLVHSLYEAGIYVCSQHEQGAAMEADGYARAKGIGCAVATSGPGFTNLITGIACSYMDSVPVIYIVGDVGTKVLRRDSGLRQLGAQEVDTRLIEPLVKYHTTVDDPANIRYELEKAYSIATSDRPGPVLIDIPEDIQRSNIDPDTLEGYTPATYYELPLDISSVVDMIEAADRPLLVIGWGLHCAGYDRKVLELVNKLGIPVAPTWGARYMVPDSHPLYAGTWGPYGSRSGNYAIQSCDLMLCIGTRLDVRQVGGSYERFAPKARKVIVDIDPVEFTKFRFRNETIAYCCDAGRFSDAMIAADIHTKDITSWVSKVQSWKEYNVVPPTYEGYVNPYIFLRRLSEYIPEDTCADTGATLSWAMKSMVIKDQRVYHAFNTTPMGYALPASIGVHYATGGRVVCIAGEGGFQMNIQELATVAKGIPITIFVLYNQGYNMIKQTESDWLNSVQCGSSEESGIPPVDIGEIAEAYGITSYYIHNNSNIDRVLEIVAADSLGPSLCVVNIYPEQSIEPKVKAGQPLENAYPYIDNLEEVLKC